VVDFHILEHERNDGNWVTSSKALFLNMHRKLIALSEVIFTATYLGITLPWAVLSGTPMLMV
jgi:hypothetical protein